MKLIVGLGNPGLGYARNRHNIGFMCLIRFARRHGIRLDKKQGQARIGLGQIAGNKVVVAKPQTFMNRSGEAVGRLINKYKVTLDDLIVIHDDLDLPLGKIRIRQGGSSAGHKGINSIISCLDNRDFRRIRVGIGRPTAAGESEIIDYVLSDFTPDERRVVADVISQVSEAIYCLLTEGPTVAMNRFN